MREGSSSRATTRRQGGLHGVGASVVNALSTELRASVKRDGALWEMSFKRGQPSGALKKAGPARGTGTTIYFHPDPTIFPKIEFDPAIIRERLEVVSYIHKGVRVIFDNEAEGKKEAFEHQEGLSDYLRKIVVERGAKPVHEAAFVMSRDSAPRLDLVLQWTESTDEHIRSYVNGIPTGSGGTHENGLRAGLGKAVRNYIDTHNLSPKGVTLTAEDIREGLTGVLSLFIAEPQFQGQTKDRLNNPEVMSLGRRRRAAGARALVNHNRTIAEAIVARIILAARAREASRAAQAESRARPRPPGRLQPARQAQ
jgi:DNA gyrase subunit B/topoisomerase-4 subunit B